MNLETAPSSRPLAPKTFLEGPAGSGKTTYATRYLLHLLNSGVPPHRILVMIPQVTLGRPYQLAVHESPIAGGMVDVMTFAGIARREIETFWPIAASALNFADQAKEPTFLNIETAQYYMAQIVTPAVQAGWFDGVSVAPARIISQVLDNLNRAAILRFPIDEVAERLIAAWGDRHSSRPPIYQTAADLARQFRDRCLQTNLIDFSLATEIFNTALRSDPRSSWYLLHRYDYLIADNIEEENPAAHDFIKWLLPSLDGALLIFDKDAGYRIFLGADPDNAYGLMSLCDEQLILNKAEVSSPTLVALSREFNRIIGETFEPEETQAANAVGAAAPAPPPEPGAAFTYAFHRYYPQMLDWTAEQVIKLVKEQNVEPRQIVVLAPYLNDSLRFRLTQRLGEENIATLSHRPSRALREESATRVLLTLTALANPTGTHVPPPDDIADALSQVIDGLDPVRARLLTSIVYRNGDLSAFNIITEEMQTRLTFLVGERYERLRTWLAEQRTAEIPAPLDHFLSRLFGEILSQPGYSFHANLEAGRVAAQLIASAARFRKTLYPDLVGGNSGATTAKKDSSDNTTYRNKIEGANREYMGLVNQGLLAALYAQSWQDEEKNAVFLAPAFTFLLRNRFVDYQFWLDVGSNAWCERLEQPLTHPHVLTRHYPADMEWTDQMEAEAQMKQLYKVVMGLTRRCRKQIYLGISDLGESGFEQRGLLLHVFQQILRRTAAEQAGGVD